MVPPDNDVASWLLGSPPAALSPAACPPRFRLPPQNVKTLLGGDCILRPLHLAGVMWRGLVKGWGGRVHVTFWLGLPSCHVLLPQLAHPIYWLEGGMTWHEWEINFCYMKPLWCTGWSVRAAHILLMQVPSLWRRKQSLRRRLTRAESNSQPGGPKPRTQAISGDPPSTNYHISLPNHSAVKCYLYWPSHYHWHLIQCFPGKSMKNN